MTAGTSEPRKLTIISGKRINSQRQEDNELQEETAVKNNTNNARNPDTNKGQC